MNVVYNMAHGLRICEFIDNLQSCLVQLHDVPEIV